MPRLSMAGAMESGERAALEALERL
jgi:hypothetical protein